MGRLRCLPELHRQTGAPHLLARFFFNYRTFFPITPPRDLFLSHFFSLFLPCLFSLFPLLPSLLFSLPFPLSPPPTPFLHFLSSLSQGFTMWLRLASRQLQYKFFSLSSPRNKGMPTTLLSHFGVLLFCSLPALQPQTFCSGSVQSWTLNFAAHLPARLRGMEVYAAFCCSLWMFTEAALGKACHSQRLAVTS